MTARDEDITWFCELLAPLGRITARRMFGGAGLYADGLIIALDIENTLYLKADALTRDRFAAAGGSPFVYQGKDKSGKDKAVTVNYWMPPEDAMDSPEAMLPWARLAQEASLRNVASKPAVRKTTAKRSRTSTKA
jgi:DNA transformation protein and related proteins